MPVDVITLSEALAQTKPKAVTIDGDTSDYEVINGNTEYVIENVNSFSFIVAEGARAHMILVMGETPNISIDTNGEFSLAFAGDDISTAAAGETWEISIDKGLVICINWGVIA